LASIIKNLIKMCRQNKEEWPDFRQVILIGVLGWVRTIDLKLRRLPLYPTELRGHVHLSLTEVRHQLQVGS
jgi:hypothetical protein